MAVKRNGILNIPWPKLANGSTPLRLDALLATATNPTLNSGRYPLAREIAKAWNKLDGKSHVCYFWKNRKNGIRTFQDDEIVGYLLDFGHMC